MGETKKNERIASLEALRAIAFLGVVFSHTNFYIFKSTGTWAVTVFFILSGFVSIVGQIDKEFDVSIKGGFKHAISRIKKIYPLHIVTTVLMLFLNFKEFINDEIFVNITKLLLNVLLIQEWIPLKSASINGVSWFLCTIILSYFIFPWVIKRFKTNYSLKKASICILFSIVLEVAVAFIGRKLQLVDVANRFIDSDLCCWFVYRFPLVRIFDIIIGYNLGYIYLMNKEVFNNRIISNEIIAIVVNIFVLIIGIVTNKSEVIIENNPAININNWWNLSLINTTPQLF